MVVTDLTRIAEEGIIKEEENVRFREMLENHNSASVDNMVFQLNESISSQIDCTKCGNCCRSLMINVSNEDAQMLAAQLQLSGKEFEEKYIECSGEGTLAVMNSIPCHFLGENKCSVYTARPKECREFPGLHHKGFTQRLFATFMHYGRCPIVYNVIEALKTGITVKG